MPVPKLQLGMKDWPQLVHLYSSGKLTCQTDKLVAIAGLAKAVSHGQPESYVAGLWRRNLDLQLCWYVATAEEHRAGETSSYIAPTWSWASVNTAVILHTHLPPGDTPAPTYASSSVSIRSTAIRHVSVKDVNIQLASADQFGPLRGASLVLQCTSLLYDYATTIHHDNHYPRIHAWPLGSNIEPASQLYVTFDTTQYIEKDQIPIYVLPVYANLRDDEEHHRLEGLVLEATGRIQGEFRRIGKIAGRGAQYRPAGSPFEMFAHVDLVCRDEQSHFTNVTTNESGEKKYFITLV